MQITLDFWNISLWLAVSGIILLITAQLVSAYDGKATLLIDQRKLKTAAVTVAIRIYGIVTSN